MVSLWFSLQGLIVKLILMTVLATLVSMEPVWMASIVTVVSALQDSQVMLLCWGWEFLQLQHLGKVAWKGKLLFKCLFISFSASVLLLTSSLPADFC